MVKRFFSLAIPLALLGALLWAIGATVAQQIPRDAREAEMSPSMLRMLTFNLRFDNPADGPNAWPLRREQVLNILEEGQWDVIGLQEALATQLDFIMEQMPGYAAVGLGRDDGRASGEFAPVLYRTDRFSLASANTFWLSSTPEIPASATWGNTVTRTCTQVRLIELSTGRALHVFNTHWDHVSQRSRAESAELIVRRIDERTPAEPVILMGDFNADEGNAAIETLLAARASDTLVDTFRVLHPEERAGTFHGWNGEAGASKIDSILANTAWRVLRAGIDRRHMDGQYPSDHFPVWAELEIVAPEDRDNDGPPSSNGSRP